MGVQPTMVTIKHDNRQDGEPTDYNKDLSNWLICQPTRINVYIIINVCMYVYIYIWVYIYMYKYACIYNYIYMHIYIYIYMGIYIPKPIR